MGNYQIWKAHGFVIFLTQRRAYCKCLCKPSFILCGKLFKWLMYQRHIVQNPTLLRIMGSWCSTCSVHIRMYVCVQFQQNDVIFSYLLLPWVHFNHIDISTECITICMLASLYIYTCSVELCERFIALHWPGSFVITTISH